MVKGMLLIVDGQEISMNEFVNSVLHDVLIAILQNLRGFEDFKDIAQIEIMGLFGCTKGGLFYCQFRKCC